MHKSLQVQSNLDNTIEVYFVYETLHFPEATYLTSPTNPYVFTRGRFTSMYTSK